MINGITDFCKAKEEGWTFIETLIVIGIVIILTGSISFMGMKYLEKAKVVSAKTEIQALSMALESYYLDNGAYPSEDQGLEALWEKPTLSPVPDSWDGPYVSKNDFFDPWQTDYVYQNPGEYDLPFTISSYGSDAYPGGEDKASDINSWED
ncbi:MAG: type II secretion system major pseudopilin GspG [Spirochaetales bacterium]|nr:type II secretion system major pseudopilin GspG [Spirochaetales bacterium]